ncbi:MAG: tetratricopeptide repeat protein [Flavobacteriales bacterium]|nr:tetratricopeptide repeat protein [Flavobacteriales bacterium]
MKKLILFILILSMAKLPVLANVEIAKIDSILIYVDDYILSVKMFSNISTPSLLSYVKDADDDLSKCKIYNTLCWRYFSSDPPRAMEYANLQNTLAIKLNNFSAKIAAYDNIAYLHKAFGDLDKSITYMLKALKDKESIRDTVGMSTSLSGLGSIYYSMNNFKLALKYYKQVYELEKKSTSKERRETKRRLAITTENIGSCYLELDQTEKALESFFKSIELFKDCDYDNVFSSPYMNIGTIYFQKNEYENALAYFKEGARREEENGDVSLLANVYGNISELYSIQNNFTKALTYGKKSVKYANLSEDKNAILKSNSQLAQVFYNNKNYQLAYEYFMVAFDMKDSIFNETSSNQIAEMQTKYNTEKKEAENSLLLVEKEIDKAELDKKSTQQKMLLLGLLLAFIIVIYVAYSLNQKKKTNKLLNTQNDEISNKNAIIEEKNKNITDSINYAQRIQDAILPEESLLKNSFESFIYYRPKDIVSGDFYWIKELEDKIFFSVVDCTGHGVPGAFMSIIGANSLNKIIEDLRIETTGEILDELNVLVNKALGKKETSDDILSIRDGMDITICCLDKTNNMLEYSGANNSLYILKKHENKINGLEPVLEDEYSLFYEIKPNKMAIGGGRNKDKYTSRKVQLNVGDSIYLFSDGYADQFGGEKGKKFMYKRFKNMFLSIQNKTMDKQLSHLEDTMENWKGDIDQLDDICVMGVRI